MPTKHDITALCTQITDAAALIKGASDALDQILEKANDAPADGGLSITELAKALFFIKNAHVEADTATTKGLYHVVERINKGILPKRMNDAGQDMVRIPEIGRSFSIRTQYSASILDKEGAFAWLRETGNEALIQETVNAGTLSSFCRGLVLEQGIDPPEDLIKFSSYDAMSINKYTPKQTVE